jgi:branched-chain amino acid transport system substrate-binding protein
MGRKRVYVLLSMLLVLSMLLGACGGKGGGKTVKVGAVYPLSGSLASTGKDLKQGVELAVDIVNNEYPDLNLPLAKSKGILGGKQLQVVFADHEGKPDKGKAEAERLITQEKVVALLGSYNSAVTKTASQAAEQAKIPFLNPESTSVT